MENKNRQLIAFFAITFTFSWSFWLLDILNGMKLIALPFSYLVLYVIGAHGPLVAALVLTGRQEGWPGIKSLLKSGFNLRMPLKWWLIILALPALLSGAALWLNVSLNHFQVEQSLLKQPLIIPAMYLMMFFIGGSVQEEFGWRGFALPRLLERWNPLTASLVLGAFWGIWHLPLFFIPEASQSFMSFGIFMILVEAFTVLITWGYLHTKGSLFSALLFHTSINAILEVFPPIEKVAGSPQMGFVYLAVAYVLAALVIVIKERALFSAKYLAEK